MCHFTCPLVQISFDVGLGDEDDDVVVVKLFLVTLLKSNKILIGFNYVSLKKKTSQLIQAWIMGGSYIYL